MYNESFKSLLFWATGSCKFLLFLADDLSEDVFRNLAERAVCSVNFLAVDVNFPALAVKRKRSLSQNLYYQKISPHGLIRVKLKLNTSSRQQYKNITDDTIGQNKSYTLTILLSL